MRISDWSSDVCSSDLIFRIGGAAGKFVENDAKAFGEHIGKDVQTASMGHAIDDFAHAIMRTIFDDAFRRRNHGFAAIQPEPLGADIFLAEEFFILLGVDHLRQNRLLALRRELDGLVLAFHALLPEAALLNVGDVNLFKADITALIGPKYVNQHANGSGFNTPRTQ